MERSHLRLCTLFVLILHILFASSLDEKGSKKPDPSDDSEKWKKKHVTDYTEADMERLFDQWEDNDEEKLEPDELPEWKRPPPQLDLTKMDLSSPEAVLKSTKKGRTLMMFATVSGNPTEKETDQISGLWQSSLYNAHIEMQRYTIGADRVLFVLNDGGLAWDVKDFLVKQDRCERVTIEGKDYPGKAYTGDDTSKENKEKVAKSVKAENAKKNKKDSKKKEKDNKKDKEDGKKDKKDNKKDEKEKKDEL